MRALWLARCVLVAVAVGAAGACAPRGRAVRVGPSVAAAVPEASPALVNAVVDEAHALIGRPYRAGGADPSGFDCSGFVSYVFGRVGVGLPRTVASLSSTGIALPPARPAAGDLLFFATSSRGASHVAIALGDGRFVHAPSSRGVVRIERLDAPYWAPRYLGARRVLPVAATGRSAAPEPRR